MNSSVSRFRDCCRTFDAANSTEAAYELGDIVEKQLPTTYQVPFAEAPLTRELLQESNARNYRALWHELVQHLTDLGYLTEHQLVTYHRLRKDIPNEPRLLVPVLFAVRQYLQEEEWPEWTEMYSGVLANLQLTQLEERLGKVVERIAHYTSFDGSLVPPTDYQVGAVNCYGRSLAFRMRTLYTMDEDLVNVFVFDRSHLKYLRSLQGILKVKFIPENLPPEQITISADYWRMLSNIDQFYQAYRAACEIALDGEEISLIYRFETDDKVVMGWPDSGSRSSLGRKLRRKVAANEKLDRIYLEMGSRILQVKLWQTHFYVDEVDQKWSPSSHAAVENLISQEREIRLATDSQRKKKKAERLLERALATASNDTKFLGLETVYSLLAAYHDNPSEQSVDDTNEADKMVTVLETLKREEEISSDTLDEKILNSNVAAELYPDLVAQPRRRVAFARKSFLAGIWRGIKQIGKWLIKGFQKILGPIFGFVKLLTSKIRAGIQQFFRGFRYLGHFLLGRPIVTYGTPSPDRDTIDVFATKFSLDFDGINLISADARPVDLKRHIAHLHDMKDSMFYFIDMTLKVIKLIGKLSQPGGWVLLGWQIARMIAGELVDIISPIA